MSAVLRASATVPSLFSHGVEENGHGAAFAPRKLRGLAAWSSAINRKAIGEAACIIPVFCGAPIALLLVGKPLVKAALISIGFVLAH